MNKRHIFLIAVMSVALAQGCTSGIARTPDSRPETAASAPARGLDDLFGEPTATPEYMPRSGDGALTRASAFPDSMDLAVSPDDRTHILLHISGYLPTPCHELRVLVPPPDDNNRIMVAAYSVAPGGVDCEQVLRAFNVTVDLGKYPAGSYTVWVNETLVGNFDV
jgi:hypothetical protein